MPVRISFEAVDIRAHVTTLELQGVVEDYIKDTYDVSVSEVRDVDTITLDPGGMAFSAETAKYIEFNLGETPFRVQPMHVQGVYAYLTEAIKMVDSPVGLLLKIYLPYCIVVLPASNLWALKARLDCYEIDSKLARAEVNQILAEANARANAPKEEEIIN